MSYKKANHLFPSDLLERIQQYIDGEAIYIPRKRGRKKTWGACTPTREELAARNRQIYTDEQAGYSLLALSHKYFLAPKSIQRILQQQRKIRHN